MSLTSVSDPLAVSAAMVQVRAQRTELQAAVDELEQLQGVLPVAECIPDWQGTAKDAFNTTLVDLCTAYYAALAELRDAIVSLDLVAAGSADV